jgi:hypothetical protein
MQTTLFRTVRRLGALAVLAGGAVHLQQYIGADYRAIPIIGPLFLLNAIGSGLVGFALLAPLERLVPDRRSDLTVSLLASAAVMIGLGSLISLYISETSSLFGFSESGYRAPIIAAIAAELATLVLLVPVAAVGLRRASARRADRTSARRLHQQGWAGHASSSRLT